MLVTITYVNGSSETFSSVTNYTNDGVVVRFTGVDMAGFQANYELSFASILKIAKQGG